MITIRAAQLTAMQAAKQNAFVDEMCAHLAGFAPEVCGPLGAPALRAAVELGIARAHAHGFEYRGPVRLYLELGVLLGSGFADDPQVPWAGATLRDGHGDQMHRACRLAHLVREHLDHVVGADGQLAQQALDRLAALVERGELRFHRPELERELLRALEAVYPDKLAAIGVAAAREIVARAEQLAREFYDRDLPRAVAVLASLQFAVGSGCVDDPLRPWIGATLRDPTIKDDETRASRLEARAVAWLSAARGEVTTWR